MKFEKWYDYRDRNKEVTLDPEFPILTESQNLIMRELKHNHEMYIMYGFSKCDVYAAVPEPVESLEKLLSIMKEDGICENGLTSNIFNKIDNPMSCMCSVAPLGDKIIFNRLAYDCYGGKLFYFSKQKVFALVNSGGTVKIINARTKLRDIYIVDRMESKGLMLRFKGDSNLSFLNIL